MPEIVERGYLYIAQPPLYKIKIGKEEIYAKDDSQMHDIILKAGIKNIEVNSIEKKQPFLIQGEDLIKTIKNLMRLEEQIDKLGRIGMDQEIIRFVIDIEELSVESIKTEEEVNRIINKINSHIQTYITDNGDISGLNAIKEYDSEHDCFKIFIEFNKKKVHHTFTLNLDFLNSPEFRLIHSLAKKVHVLGPPPYQIKRGNQEFKINRMSELVKCVIDLAKKGANIQRYKGLGEMNPDQLWETTMNPLSRRLLQVKIDDAVEADEIFTVLMGDQVDPRRKFIQENALDVKNLDI
jgi:DNA gyrase subunit B